MIASSVAWLLAAPEEGAAEARVVRTVVEQGLPLVFERSRDSTTALAITFEGPNGVRQDTLRFGGDGRAMLWLPPGTYRYRTGGAARLASAPWRWTPGRANGSLGPWWRTREADAVRRRRSSGERRASGRGCTRWCSWRSRPNGWHGAGSGCADWSVRFPP